MWLRVGLRSLQDPSQPRTEGLDQNQNPEQTSHHDGGGDGDAVRISFSVRISLCEDLSLGEDLSLSVRTFMFGFLLLCPSAEGDHRSR